MHTIEHGVSALDGVTKVLSEQAAEACISFAVWVNRVVRRYRFDDPQLLEMRLTTRSRAVRRWNRKRRRR